MGKNKDLFVVLILSMILVSCNSNSDIFKTAHFKLTKAELDSRVDSVKIVNVVDNRNNKSKIIGRTITGFFEKSTPMYINNDLSNYVKESFNTFIEKDNNQKYFTPVTVYINDYYLGIDSYLLTYNMFSRYSFTFEYPIDDKSKKSVIIKDSISKTQGGPSSNFQAISKLTYSQVSNQFIEYYFKNKSHSQSQLPAQSKSSSIEIPNNISDTLTTNNMGNNSKSGLGIQYFNGGKITSGGRIEYQLLEHKNGTRSEIGLGFGFSYFNFKNRPVSSIFEYGGGLTYRYNLSEEINSLFISSRLELIFGSVNNSFTIGAHLQESIGYYIFKQMSLSVGVYELGFLDSKILPSDIGIVATLSITGAY